MMDTEQVRLEDGSCPRCGSHGSTVVFEGEDYLYHLPGKFFASKCHHCGFWFQNPRPVLEDIPKTYPSNYDPHARPDREQTGSSSQTQFTNQIGRNVHVSTAWNVLRSPVPSRLKKYLRAIRHPSLLVQQLLHAYLQRYLGYGHLPVDEPRKLALRLMPFRHHYHKWLVNVRLIPCYVPGGRLIELGCGNGSFLSYLHSLGWEDLHGVELVAAAAQIAQDQGFSVDCGRIEDTLPQYPDSHFDVIVSAMVLEHLVNPFAVMRTIASKLKPGGQLLFSTVIRDSLDGLLYERYGVSFDFQRHMVYFRKSDILQMLGADFERVECAHQNAPSDFIRPSTWRQELNVGGLLDKIVLVLSKMPRHEYASLLLARLGLTGRVSFRCNKPADADKNV